MKKLNPTSALDAIFPQPIDCGNGIVVYPLSLAQYALLDKIGSYLVQDHEPDEIEIVKSMYICTHDAKEVLRNFDNLNDNAMDWASQLAPFVIKPILDAVYSQVNALSKVVPVTEDSKKKVVMG